MLIDYNHKLDTAKEELKCVQRDYNKLLFLYKRNIETDASVPNNTLEAVKYAMKCAHPDNGGNAEDFIKYQKCYEELKNL